MSQVPFKVRLLFLVATITAAASVTLLLPAFQDPDTRALEESLGDRSERIVSLQQAAARDREIVAMGLDGVDALSAGAARPAGDGLALAATRLAPVVAAFDAARSSLNELVRTNNQVRVEIESARDDAEKLLEAGGGRLGIKYLTKLRDALGLMTVTEDHFAKLTVALSDGLDEYAALLERTRNILQESGRGVYRTAEEASQVFALSISDLVAPIAKIRAGAASIEADAEVAAERAGRAIDEASRLKGMK